MRAKVSQAAFLLFVLFSTQIALVRVRQNYFEEEIGISILFRRNAEGVRGRHIRHY